MSSPDPAQAVAGPMSVRADVATDAPGRYAKQLVAHLGRRLTFSTEGATSTASIGDATAGITVADGVLTLQASGPDEASLARAQEVLGSHLERFARRDGLTVAWATTTAAGPERDDVP